MLGFATKAELVAVEDDVAVRKAQKPLQDALIELAQLEAREKRLIAVVNNQADRSTHDEFDEAQRVLAIRKGTQTGWYLPDAQVVRENVRPLRAAYDEAVKQAKDRLMEAGTLRLKALCGELSPVLQEAMELAEKIEALRQEVGDAGADLGEHPCPVLLPGCLVTGQVELMRAKGLL